MSPKQICVVLGMHRSGTSALTKGLTALGVDIGDKLMPAVESDNPKGYFEDLDIVNFNDGLLAKLGSNWHRLSLIDSDRLI